MTKKVTHAKSLTPRANKYGARRIPAGMLNSIERDKPAGYSLLTDINLTKNRNISQYRLLN